MIPMARPLLGAEEKKAVMEVLESGVLAQGKQVEEFEQAFARYIGVRQAIATSNGTTALHAALVAQGIGLGDEVITTPFTFIATANAIRMTGATPVFVDVEEDTFNINPDLIPAATTPRTKAILPVHLFGLPARMDKLLALAQKQGLRLIEDACQAHGAIFANKKVGSFGTGCFSFYPTKNMTTGEGGMITTDDEEVAKKTRKIINHGSEQRYHHSSLGYNYRMTNLAAALGMAQLQKLDQFNQRRRENARRLGEGLHSLRGVILPPLLEGHVFHQFTIRLTAESKCTRDQLSAVLAEAGIASSIFYPLPIHQQQAYAEYQQLHFPVAERLSKEVLSLPIHPGVSTTELERIIEVCREVL